MKIEGAFPLPPLYGYPDPQIQFLFDNMDTNPRRIPKTVTVDMMVCDLLGFNSGACMEKHQRFTPGNRKRK